MRSILAPRSFALIPAALLLLIVTTAPSAPVLAQSAPAATPDVRTADDEFSKQLSELRKTFSDLSKKIEDSAQSIGRLDNAEAARKEIEELRSMSARCSTPSPTTARSGTSASRR